MKYQYYGITFHSINVENLFFTGRYSITQATVRIYINTQECMYEFIYDVTERESERERQIENLRVYLGEYFNILEPIFKLM